MISQQKNDTSWWLHMDQNDQLSKPDCWTYERIEVWRGKGRRRHVRKKLCSVMSFEWLFWMLLWSTLHKWCSLLARGNTRPQGQTKAQVDDTCLYILFFICDNFNIILCISDLCWINSHARDMLIPWHSSGSGLKERLRMIMKAAGWTFEELIPGSTVPRCHGHDVMLADPGAYGQITEYGGQIASSSTEITWFFFDVAAFKALVFGIHLPSTELTCRGYVSSQGGTCLLSLSY